MSRKGMVPSWFGSPMVNCICESSELMCCSNCRLSFAVWMTKVFPQTLAIGRGCEAELRVLTSNSFMNRLVIRGLMGEPMAAPWTCCNTYLVRGSMCF